MNDAKTGGSPRHTRARKKGEESERGKKKREGQRLVKKKESEFVPTSDSGFSDGLQ